MNISGVSDFS